MTHHVKYVHSTPDGDNLVAYMARVSNPENQNNTETSARLIRYLIKHKHWSPFEMVNMCVEINTTRSIAAQILRHRSLAFKSFLNGTLKLSINQVLLLFDGKILRTDKTVWTILTHTQHKIFRSRLIKYTSCHSNCITKCLQQVLLKSVHVKYYHLVHPHVCT